MAAGLGTRLNPLTLAVPKPMVPIVNKPCMLYSLELLSRYGFRDVALNLHYFPEQIKNYFGDGSPLGLSLDYSYEEELLGTAGGVKKMAEELLEVREPFLILSADTLTDIPLNELMAFHKRSGPLITIALKKMDVVQEYGVVILDEARRITAFQEKPAPGEELSFLANTGIYIVEPELLRLIPPKEFHDFGRMLFPRLLKEKVPMSGFVTDAYWNDIGSIPQYLQANSDLLERRVGVPLDGEWKNGVLVGQGAHLDDRAKISAPAAVGAHARVHAGATIGPGSIIGPSSVVRHGAVIRQSILWPEVVVGESASVDRSIVGSFSYLEDGSRLEPDAVLGNRCHVRRGVTIPSGSRVAPDEIV